MMIGYYVLQRSIISLKYQKYSPTKYGNMLLRFYCISVLQYFCPTILRTYATSDLRQLQVGCTSYFVDPTYVGTADIVSSMQLTVLLQDRSVGQMNRFCRSDAQLLQFESTVFVGRMHNFCRSDAQGQVETISEPSAVARTGWGPSAAATFIKMTK